MLVEVWRRKGSLPWLNTLRAAALARWICVLGRIVGCESSRRVVSGSWGPQSFCFYICAWEKGGGYWDANNHMAGPYTFELAGGRRLLRLLIIGFELLIYLSDISTH